MKRDIFCRGVRMQHEFGATEARNDPMSSGTFKPEFPVFPKHRSAPITVQEYGEHRYFEPSSPIQKPGGGFASINGPATDRAAQCAIVIPVGTKGRKMP
jgi:hypothetical protein